MREIKLINDAIKKLSLNLKGLIVFAEVASGHFKWSPIIAALAGPPVVLPNALLAMSIKAIIAPDFIRIPANIKKMIMYVDITPMGILQRPFKLKNCKSSISLSE